MAQNRRVQVRCRPELHAELQAFARRAGLGLAPAIRQLVSEGLASEEKAGPVPTCAGALAALVAAEHALLLVASVLPEGDRRLREAAPLAAAAAEARIEGLHADG